MKKIIENLRKFWYFRIANPIVRKGEVGGFKWVFRRFDLTIETMSGNFKAKFMADEHPYGVLVGCEKEEIIHGYCAILYQVGKLLTTDAVFVSDIQKAMSKYDKRLQKKAEIEEDETEEKFALGEMKQVQEYVEKPKKERRKAEKDIDKRFEKAVKEVQK